MYEIAVNQKYKYDGYHSGLASMICKFFDKKTGLEASVNEEIAPESNKPIINSKEVKCMSGLKIIFGLQI